MKAKAVASAIYQIIRGLSEEDRMRIADFILDIGEEKYADNKWVSFFCAQLRSIFDIPEFGT